MTIREHYSHAKADGKKKKRRDGAEARQESRKQRTDKQQLAKLDAGDYTAKKERKRLEKCNG